MLINIMKCFQSLNKKYFLQYGSAGGKMNFKFLNIALAGFVMLSSSIANAGLLTVGDIVSDADGINWEYVGLYDMATGPLYYDANGDGVEDDPAPIYTGISAAEANFGTLALNQFYAISTLETAVSHQAWYDSFNSFYATKAEDFLSDAGDDDVYSQQGDFSAWVQDKAEFGENQINFVFKSIDVPEPSTFAIFSLALLAFGRRFLKK